MVDMVALLQCARPPVPATTLRQLSRIIVALVVMTGRVTMLGLARWAGKGGSYRTIQRFFATVIPWATLCWVFLRQHVYRPEDVYLVGGDAVVVTKAGPPPMAWIGSLPGCTASPCRAWPFSPCPSCVSSNGVPYPMRVEQGVRSDAAKATCKAQAAAKQLKAPCATRRPGRPKGSTHHAKALRTLTPALVRIQAL